MDITKASLADLMTLGLSLQEAKIYVELLKKPSTHLRLSQLTGINRTKVYRIAADLEKRSLIARRTDDRGMFLVAVDPSALEVELIKNEEKLKKQRGVLQNLVTDLAKLQKQNGSQFVIHTYEGAAGLRQMCWHELKTKGELLSLGNGTVEEQAADAAWARKHREKQIEAGYKTREITNYEYSKNGTAEFSDGGIIGAGLYEHRMLSPDILVFDTQTVIYNDTIAVYHWKHDQKVGLEIVSKTYAGMMRQIFEHYWQLANT